MKDNNFNNYEEAIADLYPRMESYHVLRKNLQFMPVSQGGVDTLSLARSHARDVVKWFARTSDLPRPWPQEYQDKLFNPRMYLPEDSDSVRSANSTPGRRVRNSPLNWISIEDLPLRRKLIRILVKDIGIPPHQYLPHLNATLLGASGYTLNIPALKVMLPYTTAEQSRLITLPEHLSKNASSWLNGSTLVHRMVDQHSGFMSGSDQEDIVEKVINALDLIIKHDPDVMLYRNADGHLPEEMDQSGDVGRWMEEKRKEFSSKSLNKKLKKISRDKRSLPRLSTPPKI